MICNLLWILLFILSNPLISTIGLSANATGIKELSLMQWFGIVLPCLISFPKIFLVNNDNKIILNFLCLSIVVFSIIIIKSALIDYVPLNYLLDDLFFILSIYFSCHLVYCVLRIKK